MQGDLLRGVFDYSVGLLAPLRFLTGRSRTSRTWSSSVHLFVLVLVLVLVLPVSSQAHRFTACLFANPNLLHQIASRIEELLYCIYMIHIHLEPKRLSESGCQVRHCGFLFSSSSKQRHGVSLYRLGY